MAENRGIRQGHRPLLGAALAFCLALGSPLVQAGNSEFASVRLTAPPEAAGVLLAGFRKSDVVSIDFDGLEDAVLLSFGRLRQGRVVPDQGAVRALFRDGILVVRADAAGTGALVVLIQWPHSVRSQGSGRETSSAPLTVTSDGAPSKAVLYPVLAPLVLHNDRLSPLPWCQSVSDSLDLSPDSPCPR